MHIALALIALATWATSALCAYRWFRYREDDADFCAIKWAVVASVLTAMAIATTP